MTKESEKKPIGDEDKPPLYAEWQSGRAKNAGLDTDNQARGVTRKQDEVVAIDTTDDDVVSRLYNKEDLIDHFSVKSRRG